MSGNSIGKLLNITSFGESHGIAMGVVIDGLPSKLPININELQAWVDRRSAKTYEVATDRKEADQVKILSGVFEDVTLGSPLAVIVENKSQRSQDYQKLKDQYRPGHADKTTLDKFGIRDYRGGGRASGRETISRVIAGYFAKLIIPQINISSKISKIGPFFEGLDLNIQKQDIKNKLLDLKANGESVGGEITLYIENVPAGLGDPCFEKLRSTLAMSLSSIGTCMAVEFGLGTDFASTLGTKVSQDKTNFGGLEGGISNGEPIKVKLTFKAPSTTGENAKEGRHDPCILPRAQVVVESMAAITLADHFLRQAAYNLTLPEYTI